MIRFGAEVVVKLVAGVISLGGGEYDKAIEFAVRVGTWQTQEQSFDLPLREFCAELSCLFNIEQTKDAQSSSFFPAKQSISPHQKKDIARQRTRSEATDGAKFFDKLFIITP